MLLKDYQLEIFNNECRPEVMSVQCFAHLDQDVSAALPYLNASLGGYEYIPDPPSVTFKAQGKIITVYSRKVAVNALKDETEAKKIVEWIIREINAAWENRDEIEPLHKSMPRIQMLEVLKLLPKTNCGECGAPTCLFFATQVAEGAKDGTNCPPLASPEKDALALYLKGFEAV